MADDEILKGVKAEVKEDAADIAPFDPSKKKKKKKVVIQDPADEPVDQVAETTENSTATDGPDTAFTGQKKKKKKPVQTDLLDDEKENETDDLDEGEGIILQQRLPWEGTERDYQYEEPYPVLHEKPGDIVAHIKFTVLLMPNGSDRVTSHPIQELEPTKTIDDPEIKAWLALATKTKKKGGGMKKKGKKDKVEGTAEPMDATDSAPRE